MDPRLKHIVDHYDTFKIGTDEPFPFHCVQCGKCCVHREDILLNPQDLFRMAKHLGQTPKDVVIHYCEVYTGPDSRMPLVRLLPEGEDHHCPFLVRSKCRIHEAKPTVCAMYPIGRALRVDRGTGSGEPPGIDYLFDPPGCGDQSETHTVREWLGSFHIPVDDPFFLEWQQGSMFLCESFRELEQASEIATAVLVRPMVYQRLYLDYSLQGEFLPQFRKNMEAVRQLVAGLREKVEAEP